MSDNAYIDCLHRGEMVRKEPCTSCEEETGKKINAKVFACAVHGECTLFRKDLDSGAKHCWDCSDVKV